MDRIAKPLLESVIFFIILFCCCQIVSAASISVTAPATGATWYRGQNYTITWTSSGVTGNVKLHLYKNGTFLVPISNNQSNTGSYSPFNPGSDLADGNNYQIRMVDVNTGTISTTSGYFTIQAVPPSAPPTPTGLSLTDITGGFQISWNNVSGTSGANPYKIYWGTDSSVDETYNSGIIEEDGTPSDHTGRENGATYYYRIKACNGTQCSSLSGIVSRTYGTLAPSPPTLTAPADNGAVPIGESITFQWTNSSGSVSNSSIKVCTDAAMTQGCQFLETGLIQAIVSDSMFTPGVKQYWQARSKTSTSAWGVYGPTPAWTFTVSLAAPPTLAAPADNSTVPIGQNITFQWTNSSGSVSNSSIKVCTDAAMTQGCQFFETGLTQTIVSDSMFTPGVKQYWQARSKTSTSDWGIYGPSPAWTFTVSLAAPPTPTGLSLADITGGFQISWDDVSGTSGANPYKIYWGTSNTVDEDNKSGIIEEDGTPSDHTDRESGTTYYYRIKACNGTQCSQLSSTVSRTYSSASATPMLNPLYRLYKSNSGSTIRDHFYTVSKAEADNAVANLGYSSEGIECYVANTSFTGSLPLYRLYKSSSTSHYYTTSDSDKAAKVTNDGYAFEKIEGYVSGIAGEGLVGLHRLKQSTGTPDHYFLTTKKHEYDAVKGGTYGPYTEDIPEGIGYAYPTGLREPTAHHRPQGNYEGVDLASGAFTGYASLDLSLKGRGPQLSFSHHYNSFNFNQHPLAQGWSHNLESYIVEDVNGNVTVKWGDGTVSYFEKTGSGVSDYLDKSGAHDILTRQIDGMNYGYDLKKKNQTTFNFRRFNVNPPPETLPDNIFLTDGDRFKIALITVKDWAERKLTLDHEAAYGTIIEARDDLGRKYVFRYDTVPRRLIRVEEQVDGALKRAISFGYNDQGLLSTYTDAEGKVTRYFYNGYGLLESIQYPMGNTITIGYNTATQQVESVKNGDKPPASIQYNVTPTVTQVTDPRGKIFNYTHDAFKLTAQQGQGEANPVRFVYGDPLNFTNPTHTEDKMEYSTDYEYDAMGNVKKITNARLNVANYRYNDKNNLTSAEEFHAAGVSVTPTIYEYDATGYRLDRITNPKNEATKLTYNANKQVEKIINGLEQETLIQYDRFGNPWKITDAEGNTTQYDSDWAGRTSTVIDGETKRTKYEFDNNDHLTRIINHRNLAVEIPYNDNGLQDKVRWSNEGTVSQTAYHYNSQNQLDTLTNPLSIKSTYGYNAAGLLETLTDFNGSTRTYNYDDRNRLQNIVYSDHTTIFGHNANGLVSSVTAPTGGASQIDYNELNLIKKVTDPFGKVVQYEHDTAGRLWTITYPGGKIITYLYDAAGRLEYVNDWVGGSTRYIYDAAGNLKEIQRPNGTKAVYGYDLASRLTGIAEKKADDTVICAYAYNNLNGVGNPRSVAVTEPLTAGVPDADIAYVRDLLSNRLTVAGSASYTYDNNGNRKTMVLGSDTTTYDWDGENMLTSISGAGKSLQYKYDGMSNRIARTEAGVTTRYVLDLSGDMSRVLAETDESGNVNAYYVYGIGLISRITTSDTRSFYHYNNRGDAIALTDDAGNITDKYAYDEYGKLMASEGTTANPFKYVGRYGVMDEGTNFYFMRARYYDATTGRFLNEDPLGFNGGDWNLFAYVGGNPVTMVDPEGLASNSKSSVDKKTKKNTDAQIKALHIQQLIRDDQYYKEISIYYEAQAEFLDSVLTYSGHINPVVGVTINVVRGINDTIIGDASEATRHFVMAGWSLAGKLASTKASTLTEKVAVKVVYSGGGAGINWLWKKATGK